MLQNNVQKKIFLHKVKDITGIKQKLEIFKVSIMQVSLTEIKIFDYMKPWSFN